MKKERAPSPVEKLLPNMVGGRVSEMATYADLFANMPDAIFLLDPETLRVVDHNPAAALAFARPGLRIDGSCLLDGLTGESRDLLERRLRALRTEQKVSEPFDCTLPGNLVLEVSACRLRLADYCEVLQVIGKDVTRARADAAALVRANAELDQLARTDALTGLFNRRSLQQRLEEEHERARRYGKPYALILCDIDHFKNYNDQNGHPEGDVALRLTASLLRQRARLTDFVARYGGEEFVVLCPEVSAAQAGQLAEALRASVAKEIFPHGAKQPLGSVTISLGVAGFPADGKQPEEILQAADRALYQSKARGRNRVTMFERGLPEAGKKKAA